MAVTEPIIGKYIELKSCTEEDAEFTSAIRNDPEFVKYLPKLNNTLEQQKAWIRQQRKDPSDYFFVVWDKEGNRIGTISIYNLNDECAESGRLAIKGSNPYQAIEAQLLCFSFAYYNLSLKYTYGFIYSDNKRAIKFGKQFGAKICPEEVIKNGSKVVNARTDREDFDRSYKRLKKLLYE